MDSTIIASIVGAASAVAAPIVTVLITRYFDNRNKQAMSLGRRAVMTGQWRGTTTQEVGELASFPIVVRVEAKHKTISGTFYIQYPETGSKTAREDEFTFQGGFLYDSFLQLDYISKDGRRVQFGSIILELLPDGKTLLGRYVGYGAFSRQVVSGHLTLKRAG